MASDYYTIRLSLPPHHEQDDLALISASLEDITLSSLAIRKGNVDTGPWILEWVSENKKDPETLIQKISDHHEILGLTKPDFLKASDFVIEALPEKNWLEECYRAFPPFEIGDFFIYGSHYEGAVPQDKMGLQIDAANAFGSGEHGTTKGCLNAMLALKEEGVCPWNILDMGCGSGILSIAAWKLWKTPVLAVDIDQRAVEVSEHHQKLNQVPHSPTDMMALQGDGFHTAAVQRRSPYDLIIANILAGPLVEMAGDLAKVTDSNGLIILSGMKSGQAARVWEAYKDLGYKLQSREDIDDWSTLVLMH